MTDLEIVELAARRASLYDDAVVRTVLIALADNIFQLVKERAEWEEYQHQQALNRSEETL